MANVFDVLGGPIAGGLFGTIGSLASNWLTQRGDKAKAQATLAQSQLDNAHELELLKLRGAQTETEHTGAIEMAGLTGSFSGLVESIKDQAALSARLSPWAADILGLFRPFLTLVLILGSLAFVLVVQYKLGAASKDYLLTMWRDLSTITTMAVAWWFGDRQQRNNSSAQSGPTQ